MRDACTAGTISATKLRMPPVALIAYALPEMLTHSLVLSVSSEKAGV